MTAKTLRTVTDLALFGAMCFLAGTGLLIHYRLVPGFMGGHGLTVLGFSRHQWGTCHLWAAYLLLLLLLVHLALNWTFIRNCIAAKRTWIAIALGLIGAAFVSAFLLVPVERTGDGSHRQGARDGQGSRGQENGAD